MKETWRSRWYDMGGYIGCSVIYSDGSRRTVLQHREVMEAVLGRKLSHWEFVHHRDGDKKNNSPKNLELMAPGAHARHHHPMVTLDLQCIGCGTWFKRHANTENQNRKRGKKGPFCGKSCATKWSGRSSRAHVPKHGTENEYSYRKCRCEVCLRAHRDRMRNWLATGTTKSPR